jgi:tetratricopeptide (TPR) repeat protein
LRLARYAGTSRSRALEAAYGARAEEHAAELAEHFSHSTDAEDLGKAVEYGEQAAKRAMSVFAYGEAVGHLDQALKAQEVLAPEDHGRLCDLYRALGLALIPAGEPRRAMDFAAYNAFTRAEEIGDRERAFEACRVALEAGVIATNLTAGLHPVWLEWMERAERYASGSEATQLRFNESKAATLAATGQTDEAKLLMEDSLARARQAGLADVEYVLAANLAMLYEWHTGDQARAMAVVNQYRTHDGVGELLHLLRGLTIAWVVYSENGQRAKAGEVIEELAALHERTKAVRAAAVVALGQAVEMFADGRFDDALLEQEQAGEIYRAAGGSDNTYERYAGIRFHVEILRQPPEQVEPPEGASRAAVARRALRLAKLGASQEALGLVSSLIGPSLNVLGSIPHGLVIALEAVVDLRELELAEEIVTRLRPQSSLVFMNGVVARHIADAFVLLGRSTEALEYYQQALTLAEEMRFRPELALTRAHLAELLLDHYPEEHDTAIEHLDFAIAEFRDMKMQPALERALGRRGLLKA